MPHALLYASIWPALSQVLGGGPYLRDLPTAKSGTGPYLRDLPTAKAGTGPYLRDLPYYKSWGGAYLRDLPSQASKSASWGWGGERGGGGGAYLRDLPSQASQRASWGVPRAAGTAVIAYLLSTYLAVIYRSCKSKTPATVKLLYTKTGLQHAIE